MSSKKPRNRKYNKRKGQRSLSLFSVKNYLVGFVANKFGVKTDVLILDSLGNAELITKSLADAITTHPYKWTVFLGVLDYDDMGRKRVKPVEVACNENMHHYDLVEVLNKEHSNLIKSVDEDKLIGVGWLASPSSKELSTKQALDIFDKLGGWDETQQ